MSYYFSKYISILCNYTVLGWAAGTNDPLILLFIFYNKSTQYNGHIPASLAVSLSFLGPQCGDAGEHRPPRWSVSYSFCRCFGEVRDFISPCLSFLLLKPQESKLFWQHLVKTALCEDFVELYTSPSSNFSQSCFCFCSSWKGEAFYELPVTHFVLLK